MQFLLHKVIILYDYGSITNGDATTNKHFSSHRFDFAFPFYSCSFQHFHSLPVTVPSSSSLSLSPSLSLRLSFCELPFGASCRLCLPFYWLYPNTYTNISWFNKFAAERSGNFAKNTLGKCSLGAERKKEIICSPSVAVAMPAACHLPPAACHLPPVARSHLTPHSLPRPALACLVVHTSKCCATYALYNFVPQFPLCPPLSSVSAPSFLFPLYLILFFSHSQVSLAHAFRLSSCHAHRIFSNFFFLACLC